MKVVQNPLNVLVSQFLGLEFDGNVYLPLKTTFLLENRGLHKIRGCRHATVAPLQPSTVTSDKLLCTGRAKKQTSKFEMSKISVIIVSFTPQLVNCIN